MNHNISPPKAGLSLTLTSHRQTYSLKCKPKRLPNKTLSFSWDGSAHNTHNTVNFSDWLIFHNLDISLVAMLTSISQSQYDFSQPDSHHTHPFHIFTCHVCHILWKNLQAYNIEGAVQQERNTKTKEHAKL